MVTSTYRVNFFFQAVENLGAERIGHGYHVVDDEGIYASCLRRNIHFEACPRSSLQTGSVPQGIGQKHPIRRFAEDNANFSINRDGPAICMTTLKEEMDIARGWGLTEAHLTRAVGYLGAI